VVLASPWGPKWHRHDKRMFYRVERRELRRHGHASFAVSVPFQPRALCEMFAGWVLYRRPRRANPSAEVNIIRSDAKRTARKLLTVSMVLPNIVVIGGSAGALEPLMAVVASLPEELGLSVFVVVHAWPDVPALAAPLLAQAGPLRVRCAQDGDPIRRGTLLVAPPDRHLIVKEGFVRLARSPRENFWRPAVDVLFRSAAVAYGARVIGVILSGALDDGSAGGRAIKRCGGTVIVQSPTDARFPEMPRSAVEAAPADYVVPHRAIPGAIQEALARIPSHSPRVPEELAVEARFAEGDGADDTVEAGAPVQCGACGRPRLRPELTALDCSMDEGNRDAALWAAIRHFEQRAARYCSLAGEQQSLRHPRVALIYMDRASEAQTHARALRKLLFTTAPVAQA
jgi:two-component system chemotaxis response regulator CheB